MNKNKKYVFNMVYLFIKNIYKINNIRQGKKARILLPG